MDALYQLIGNGDEIAWWQMSVRGVIIVSFLIALIRIGSLRAFGKNSAFDIVLSVLVGSILSRALTGNAPLFPVLAAASVIVAFHWVLATFAFRSGRVGFVVKGRELELIRDGELQCDVMRKAKITKRDLREAMRHSGLRPDLKSVRAAYLERNGTISVIAD